jgi:SAM-dependent methyltransferase
MASQKKTERRSSSSGTRKRAARSRYSASTSDKYDLYQKAVQSPDTDVEWLARTFRATRGRPALHFREDFCGTGLLSSHWIQRGSDCTAEGFDIDPEPVAWGLAHNFDHLGAAAQRYTVHLKDVRSRGHRPADLRVAQNFSYCVFKTRRELLAYFRAARESLAPDGLFVIDLHGGSEATEELEETRRCGGFTYVWDQAAFWPGTGEYRCYIHFRFPDGSELKRAFTYDWRMWYLTELRDVLLDAGFARADTYFEGTDAKGTGGDGVFRKNVRGENCLSWIAYLVGVK